MSEETTEKTSEQATESEKMRTEEFRLNGDELVGKVRELVHQGNIRRLILQTEEGKTLIEVPMTIGVAGMVAGALFLPTLAAIGAIAALVTKVNLVVEREGE